VSIPQRLTHSTTPFRDRPRPVQLVLACVLPAIVGGVAGVLLGANAIAYIVLGLVAAVGQWLSGFEHGDGWGAADRGFVGGLIYGTSLLLIHAAVGTHAKVSLGSFPPLLAVLTALVGMLIAASSGRLARIERERVARAERDRLRREGGYVSERSHVRLAVTDQPIDG
jgi:hypothetical protein